MAVVVEGVAVGDLTFDAADGEVHLREPPRRVVRLLPVDRDVALRPPAVSVAGRVGADELDRLHEHARRAAAGIVDPALPRLQHLDQEPDHAARGVELAALLPLRARELRKEVLVDAAEHVPGAGVLVADPDVAHEVDELAEAQGVERGAGVVLREHVLEHGVVALDAGHGVVDQPADGRLSRLRLQMRPPCLLRNPEDVLGPVLVRVLRIGAFGPFRFQPGVPLLEGVGDVLEEDEAEDDVFVLGRVHAAAQGVGHAPQLRLVAGRGAGGAPWCRAFAVRPGRPCSCSCHALCFRPSVRPGRGGLRGGGGGLLQLPAGDGGEDDLADVGARVHEGVGRRRLVERERLVDDGAGLSGREERPDPLLQGVRDGGLLGDAARAQGSSR